MLASMRLYRSGGKALGATVPSQKAFSRPVFRATIICPPISRSRYISNSSSRRSRENTKIDFSSIVDFKDNSLFAPKTPKKCIAYIALGSNLGDRVDMIEQACRGMSVAGIKIKRTSSLWETEPMYVTDQDSFINGVCEVETTLAPLPLLRLLQSIEKLLGRQKVREKGPRNIDLDVLLYEDQVVNHQDLQIPHPGIYEREFVLRPLAELIPGQTLNPASPWKCTLDYLDALPTSTTPISTLTPLAKNIPPIRALQSDRKTHVMAIFNVTPDSFSDGGLNFLGTKDLSPDEGFSDHAMAERLADCVQGRATMIDIGGQSTAPGAPEVPEMEEISRVIPSVKLVKALYKTTTCPPISVDTYRAAVAEAAVNAGADIINDVGAGSLDSEMLPTVARLGKTICLMHMRGTPATMNTLTDYSPNGLVPTIAQELLERVAAAEAAGIWRWRIILDPGIGFAKTQDQNLEILRRFDELRDWPGLRGLPWLVGASRKKFIGNITCVVKPQDRIWGTAATVAAAIQGGADIVRVHDVARMAQVAKMSDAIWRV